MALLLRTASVLALLAVLSAPPAEAQITCSNGTEASVDPDRDCIPSALEAAGYTAGLQMCAPGSPGCFVTDSLTWSSDGDPYSDFQEATGINMESSVEAPYNHPLVAAMPAIDVELVSYTYTPEAQITDASGGSLSTATSNTFSIEATVSASYTFGVAAGATVSGSITGGYSRETSTTDEVNWETATTTDLNEAARLTLNIQARNRGGASAQNVTPTFNLYIGGELVSTIRPDGPLPTGNDGLIGPGDVTDVVALSTTQSGDPIFVTLPQLRRLRTGAPIEIRVVNLNATVIRWTAGTNNWNCGSSTCAWGPFIQQVEARTTRLLIDFGFSGDPDTDPGDLSGPFRGSPFDYRVFTGSPFAEPEVTLRDALGYLGLANPTGGGFSIVDRPYPTRWVAQEGPLKDADGFTFRENFEMDVPGGVWPRDLLDYELPRRTELLLASPLPGDNGPFTPLRRLRRDLRDVSLAAQPRGSIAVDSAKAYLSIHGEEHVVEMDRILGTNEFRLPKPTALPISLSSSYAIVTDVLGNTSLVGFEPTGFTASSCSDLPNVVYQQPGYFEPPTFGVDGGITVVFADGDLGLPMTVFCARYEGITQYPWVPQDAGLGTDVRYREIAVLDAANRVVVGEGVIARSSDGGATWTRMAVPGSAPSNTLLGLAFREGGAAGAEVGVAVGENGTVIRTEDGGETWTASSVAGTPQRFEAVDYAGGDTWYAAGGDRVIRSTDDGRTWGSVPFSLPGGRRFDTLTAVEFVSETEGVVGDARMNDGVGRIYATLDGATWTETAAYTDHHDIAYNGRDLWVIVGDQGIWVQDDLLRPGTKRQVLPANGAEFRSVDFGSPEVGFAVDFNLSRGDIFRTDDGGETWQFTGGYPDLWQPGTQQLTGVDALDENVAAVAGLGSLLGATDSGGGFPTFAPGTPVSNEAVPTEAPVAQVDLAPNVPNPFRGRTDLTFSLAAAGDVTLVVYDLLGREVARLVDAPLASGEHRVRFDARGLSAGVYVTRLAAGGAVATRQMTLIR